MKISAGKRAKKNPGNHDKIIIFFHFSVFSAARDFFVPTQTPPVSDQELKTEEKKHVFFFSFFFGFAVEMEVKVFECEKKSKQKTT